jgi:hypothetical protein
MFSLSRRRFLKAGTAGVAVLFIAQCLQREAMAQSTWRVLNEKSAELIAALATVMLEGSLPDQKDAHRIAIGEVVAAMDRAIAGLSPAIQDEIQQLFSLLTFAPTRALLAGVWKPWPEASAGDIESFLQSWRNSRFMLLQSGYEAIRQLLQACWYGNPLSWEKIGYPGVPLAKELGI